MEKQEENKKANVKTFDKFMGDLVEKELVNIDFDGEPVVTTKQGEKKLFNLMGQFNELNHLNHKNEMVEIPVPEKNCDEIEIQIPRHLNNTIETFIQDDCIERVFGYTSIQDFVIKAIEGVIKADKDTVLEES